MSKTYVKYGSESSFRGLNVQEIDSSYLNYESNIPYEIISQEEYDSYIKRMKENPSYVTEGRALLNEEGKKLYDEMKNSSIEEVKKIKNRKISFFINKIKKQIELGIISKDDIELEIGLFKDANRFRNEIMSAFDIEG